MEQTGEVGPTRVPFMEGERASLEGACISFDARSEERLGHPSRESEEKRKNRCKRG